jgi:hypothetical protein
MTGLRTFTTLCGTALALFADEAMAREFPIGGGINVTLGDSWTGTSMQNPAMRFAGMKDMMDEATESRLRGPGSGVLVSYMKFKTDKPAKDVTIDDGANVVKSAKTIYGSQATEAEPVPTVHRNGDTVRAYVTLHPKPGAGFNVAPGYPTGCVTTGTIRLGAAIHNVSIASESCESAAHREALAAIFEVGSP